VRVDLDSIADELYGLPPTEFTAARTEREKAARADGQKALAAQIHRLAKPNLTAWLANQLVRSHPGDIASLIDLGARLREATAAMSGDELRELSSQQRRLVTSLVGKAKRLAVGRTVGGDAERELESTLRAALADAGAGAALQAGRLVGALHNSGFGAADDIEWAPVAPRPRLRIVKSEPEPEPQPPDDSEERAAAARRARDEASAAVEAALAALTGAGEDVERLGTEVTAADERIAARQAELEEARASRRALDHELSAAVEAHAEAQRVMQQAQAQLAKLH
jgi:hypothetical protein